jgi:16S rRNA (guanine966-N2)-methyltransferase
MIQIASGLFRGLPLKAPRGDSTRPTSQRLRQSIFNVLRHFAASGSFSLDGAAVADLFAGTGALGFEALSNGASSCTFVESDRGALGVLGQNVEFIRTSCQRQQIQVPSMHILAQDVAKAYSRLQELDLILCDPPYRKLWPARILELEAQYGRLRAGGILLIEEASSESLLNEIPAVLRPIDSKIYGDSAVHLFVKV